ncbi:MAG: hypothetical protein GF311_02685 [Candidatus Lokiarchaeota archaeon]|nr:hypothetical protein [Candidatus Lokiarchaeota archaeon]
MEIEPLKKALRNQVNMPFFLGFNPPDPDVYPSSPMRFLENDASNEVMRIMFEHIAFKYARLLYERGQDILFEDFTSEGRLKLNNVYSLNE